jgi:hypothetical protein
MTTRRWIIVIALAGMLLGAFIHTQRFIRRYRYRMVQARHFDASERYHRARIDDPGSRHLESADADAALARAYRYLAFRPWLTVEPNPPEPQ